MKQSDRTSFRSNKVAPIGLSSNQRSRTVSLLDVTEEKSLQTYRVGDRVWIKRKIDSWWRCGKIVGEETQGEHVDKPGFEIETATSAEEKTYNVQYDYQPMFQLDELAAKIKIAIDENEVAQVAALTKTLKKEQDKKYKIAELKRKVKAGIAERHIVEEHSRHGGESAQQNAIQLQQNLEKMSIELKALLTQGRETFAVTAAELRPDHATDAYHTEAWPGKSTDQHTNAAVISPSTRESETQSKYGQNGETKTQQQQQQQPIKKQISTSEAQTHPEDQTHPDPQKQPKLNPRTLLRMVNTVTVAGAESHLLFLTNKQATSLSKKIGSTDFDNVLKAFDICTESVELVINLLPDHGMSLMTHRTQSGELREGATHTGPWGSAFASPEIANIAEDQLVCFCRDVIVPLASRNSALVLVSASDSSVLAKCFVRAASNVEASVRKEFAVLGCSPDVHSWMEGEESPFKETRKCWWRDVMKQSKKWKAQQEYLDEVYGEDKVKPGYEGGFYSSDLLPGLDSMIIIDSFDPATRTFGNWDPFKAFYDRLIGHLFKKYINVTFKTGFSKADTCTSLRRCLDSAAKNSPVVLLDSLTRPPILRGVSVREKVRFAQMNHSPVSRRIWLSETEFGEIMGNWTPEIKRKCVGRLCVQLENENTNVMYRIADATLNMDFLAYAKALFSEEPDAHPAAQARQPRWLFQAIKDAKREQIGTSADVSDMTQKFLGWYTGSFDPFYHPLRCRGRSPDSAEIEKVKRDFITQATQLLQCRKVYGVQTSDVVRANQILKKITSSSLLPEKQSLGGLRLLREGWLHYDNMMHLAGLYKMFARGLHALLLFLSFVTIVCVSVQARVRHASHHSALYNGSALPAEFSVITTTIVADTLWVKSYPDKAFQALRYTIFGLAIVSTFLVGLATFVNPDARWHHLRATSAKVKSLIWHYRTRTGPFGHARADDPEQHALADKILGQELSELMQHSVKSGDLSLTLLFGRHSKRSSHYKHGQFHPPKNSSRRWCAVKAMHDAKASDVKRIDDHYSPVTPEDYFRYRIAKMIRFYQERLPTYQRYRTCLHMVTLLCGAGGAVFAHLEAGLYVAMIASLSASMLHWANHVNSTAKVRRYSNTIEGLKSLVTHWHSLDATEQSSLKSVTHLVTTAEMIIMEENRSWFRIYAKKKKDRDGGDKQKGS